MWSQGCRVLLFGWLLCFSACGSSTPPANEEAEKPLTPEQIEYERSLANPHK
jgi:hypothetical protein